MNKFCELWNSQYNEREDDFAAWKLYVSDNEIIREIHKLIQWGNFTSEGFAEGCYKDFFLHHACLADNAIRVLIEMNIMNSTCNINWTLNFNINSEVWKRLFTWRTHLNQLSLNDHSKLQIFMNYLLSEKHKSEWCRHSFCNHSVQAYCSSWYLYCSKFLCLNSISYISHLSQKADLNWLNYLHCLIQEPHCSCLS